MTTQHTPGPWHHEQALRADGMPIPYQWTVEAQTTPAPGTDETYVHIADTHSEANASLISAAPDLLAACKAVALLGPTPQTMIQIRAAIAKAEGK